MFDVRAKLWALWFAPFWVVYRCLDVVFERRIVPYPLGVMANEDAPLFLRLFCPSAIWFLVGWAAAQVFV